MSGKCVKPSLKQRVLPIPIAKEEWLPNVTGKHRRRRVPQVVDFTADAVVVGGDGGGGGES
ncbi:hypothetical protein HanXRQr2_Chr04g0152101 [Helianthus annuus]|uniref:Uncharacterized protein n=1 Tax=Helianthus annuus TaxID=4232 RepID=A0A9K3J588_HELAN|nr:hypothetical protein HanXRQr2_Chr04g0152101 [Helianthus annuus]KAJ0930189.1 hypothetical protein HanPSC8_Chr04g0146461 [Helianthus annuus]